MPQLPELEGRAFAPFIEVRVETKIASAEEAEEILRARIERIRRGEAEKSEKRNLGEMTPSPHVYLKREKITKNKIVETRADKETFAQVLVQLMEEYGASLDRFRVRGTLSLECREYPTNYEYLFFRSETLLNEKGDIKSIDWDIIFSEIPFPSI